MEAEWMAGMTKVSAGPVRAHCARTLATFRFGAACPLLVVSA
jgi:hypothetical protein